MDSTLKRLLSITADCDDNMHEPDEQDVSAQVVGHVLNDLFGYNISTTAIMEETQELVVVMMRGRRIEVFNLATLIALARKADLGRREV